LKARQNSDGDEKPQAMAISPAAVAIFDETGRRYPEISLGIRWSLERLANIRSVPLRL